MGAGTLQGDQVVIDYVATNYAAVVPSIEGHLAGIDAILGAIAAGNTRYNVVVWNPSIAVDTTFEKSTLEECITFLLALPGFGVIYFHGAVDTGYTTAMLSPMNLQRRIGFSVIGSSDDLGAVNRDVIFTEPGGQIQDPWFIRGVASGRVRFRRSDETDTVPCILITATGGVGGDVSFWAEEVDFTSTTTGFAPTIHFSVGANKATVIFENCRFARPRCVRYTGEDPLFIFKGDRTVFVDVNLFESVSASGTLQVQIEGSFAWTTSIVGAAWTVSSSFITNAKVFPSASSLIKGLLNNGTTVVDVVIHHAGLNTFLFNGVPLTAVGNTLHFLAADGTYKELDTDMILNESIVSGLSLTDALNTLAGAFPSPGAGLDSGFNVVAADGSIVVNPDSILVGVINATQHGNQTDGGLHALANNTSNGFAPSTASRTPGERLRVGNTSNAYDFSLPDFITMVSSYDTDNPAEFRWNAQADVAAFMPTVLTAKKLGEWIMRPTSISAGSESQSVTNVVDCGGYVGIRCEGMLQLRQTVADAIVNPRYLRSDRMCQYALSFAGTSRAVIFNIAVASESAPSFLTPVIENFRYCPESNVTGKESFITVTSAATGVKELTLINVSSGEEDTLIDWQRASELVVNCIGVPRANLLSLAKDDPSSGAIQLTIHDYTANPTNDVFTCSTWDNGGRIIVNTNAGARKGLQLTGPVPAALYNFGQLNATGRDESTNDFDLAIQGGTATFTKGSHQPGKRAWVGDGTRYWLATAAAGYRTLGALTIEVLVYIDAALAATAVMVSCGASGETEAANLVYHFAIRSDKSIEVIHEYGAGNNEEWQTPAALMPTGRFVHLALTRASDGLTYRIWIDGKCVARRVSANAPTGGTTGALRVGAGANSGDIFNNGIISGVKVSLSEASADDIARAAMLTMGLINPPTWFHSYVPRTFEEPPLTTVAGFSNVPNYLIGGTVTGNSAAVTPSLPAGSAAGDLALMFVETAGQAVTVAGWTLVTTIDNTTTRLTMFSRTLTTGSDATTTSDSGDHQIAVIIVLKSGTFDVSNPISSIATAAQASATAASAPGISGYSQLCRLFMVSGGDLPDANAIDQVTGDVVFDSGPGVAPLIEEVNASGNGGSLVVATDSKLNDIGGAIANVTFLMTSARAMAHITFAIAPDKTKPPNYWEWDFRKLWPGMADGGYTCRLLTSYYQYTFNHYTREFDIEIQGGAVVNVAEAYSDPPAGLTSLIYPSYDDSDAGSFVSRQFGLMAASGNLKLGYYPIGGVPDFSNYRQTLTIIGRNDYDPTP